ncbi:hypothetical protein OAR33_00245 [bacterium]|nr:hypothetical protein [bacterium]MDC0991983.1 hypothetical protein [bacterium]
MPDHDPDDESPRTHFDCPWCSETSRIETWLAIGVSHALPFDPILGSPNRLRFTPSRFGPDGRPVDPEGTPCDCLACPRCRRGVPWTGTGLPFNRVTPGAGLLAAIDSGDLLNDDGDAVEVVQEPNPTPEGVRAIVVEADRLIQVLAAGAAPHPILDVLDDGRTLGPLPVEF